MTFFNRDETEARQVPNLLRDRNESESLGTHTDTHTFTHTDTHRHTHPHRHRHTHLEGVKTGANFVQRRPRTNKDGI